MGKIRIFISYSSKDREAAESVHERLAAAGFDVWRDQTRLETDWSREIASALAESDVLCLIWTENSATSKWVRHEWLTARALEKRIIPCLFPTAPSLPEPLHNLHGVSFPSLEEGSKKFIERINGEASLPVKYDYTVLPANSYIPFNPNPFFTGRHADLLELYLKMIGNLNKIGINQVGTVGMGGIGKTQLAVEFAFRFAFGFQAIYWIQAADPDRWTSEFVSIARDRLELEVKDRGTPQADRQYIFALQEHFKNHPNTVVVMDNVVEPKLLNNDTYLFGVTPLTLGCDLLFTTRRHFQLPGVLSQPVNVLSSDAAYDLLKSYRVPKAADEEGYARAICNATGHLPLAITLAGAYLREYQEDVSFDDYYQELAKNRLGAIDIGDMSEEDLATRHIAAVKATLKDQWEMLKNEDARHIFKLAGQFPEAAIIPRARLGLLARFEPGQSKIDQPLATALNLLHNLSLVERLESDASSVRLHPLVRDFSFNLFPEKKRTSFRRAAANRLKDAYFDYPRLEAEIQTRGFQQVIDDLQTGLDWLGTDGDNKKDLELLHDALRLSSHLLVRHPNQLAGQLIGRLIDQESVGLHLLLAQARTNKRGPWLSPYNSSMFQPGGSLIRTLTGHIEMVNALSVTQDGRRVVSGSEDGTLKVWDLQTGRVIRTMEGHAGYISVVSVMPDGRRAVSGSEDRTLKIWNLETGRVIRTMKGHVSPISALSVMPDGRRAISGSMEGTFKVWNLETGRVIRTMKGSHYILVNALSVMPDGRRAISGSEKGTLIVWDLETGRKLKTLKRAHDLPVSALCVTPDGRRAISGSITGTFKVWDLEKGRKPKILKGRHRIWVNALSMTLDGRRAISGSEEGTLIVWDLETGRKLRTLERHAGRVNTLCVSPDGRRVISGSKDTTLKVWDLQTGLEPRILEHHTERVNALSVTQDGRRVVSGSEDGTLKVWDLQTGRLIRTMEGHAGYISVVSVTQDGKRAYSGSRNGTLTTWDLEAGRKLKTTQPWGNFNALFITPNRRRVIFISVDGTLQVWDLKKGRGLRTIEEGRHARRVISLSVTRFGGEAISGSEDGTLKVWDLQTGRVIRTLEGHTGLVRALL